MVPFIKMMQTPESIELMKYPKAFMLAVQIARRARRMPSIVEGLGIGEAKIGDYASIGLTEQEYRTAKKRLKKCGFATFRATNRGTIAMLTDTRLFDINAEENNALDNGQATGKQRPNNGQPTDSQRTDNGQATTNKKDKKEKIDNKVIKTHRKECEEQPRGRVCVDMATHFETLKGVFDGSIEIPDNGKKAYRLFLSVYPPAHQTNKFTRTEFFNSIKEGVAPGDIVLGAAKYAVYMYAGNDYYYPNDKYIPQPDKWLYKKQYATEWLKMGHIPDPTTVLNRRYTAAE